MFKKIFLLSFIICLGLSIGLTTLAQEDLEVTSDKVTSEEIIIDETVEPEDLDEKEPSLLPSSRLYFLKEWGRGIRSFFTFGKLNKAEFESGVVNEKILELKKMVEEGEASDKIIKAVEKYEKSLEKLKKRADKIKERADESEEVSSFLDKYTHQQTLHQRILEKLGNQVPEDVFERISEAREEHLERFKDIMLKLENKEKIGERIEKALEDQEGSRFKGVKDLELLKRLKDKMPQIAKEGFNKPEERILENLKITLEELSEEDQDKFQEYIGNAYGNKDKIIEILEDVRIQFRNGFKTREWIEGYQDKVIKDINTSLPEQCPVLSITPCLNGRAVFGKDNNGCIVDYKCVPKECPQRIMIFPDCPDGRIVYDKNENGCIIGAKCVTAACPQIMIIPPDCPDGRIVYDKNENGCIIGAKCVEGGEGIACPKYQEADCPSDVEVIYKKDDKGCIVKAECVYPGSGTTQKP